MQNKFVYIWKYFVKEEYIAEFLIAYGKEGEWVKFFQMSNDYNQTKLFQDSINKSVFITLDYWSSKESKDRFIKKHQSKYDEIDIRCKNLTLKEEFIGVYFQTEGM